MNFKNNHSKNFFKRIFSNIKYYFDLKFKIKNIITDIESIVFFTPFCAPHLSRILSNFKCNNVFYAPIPLLQLKGYLNNQNLIIPSEHSILSLSMSSFIRILKLRLFFGKNLSLVKLGHNLEPALKSHVLKQYNFIEDIFSINEIKDYDNYYLSQNYISSLKVNIDEKPSLIYYDQHYVHRNLVNSDIYYKLLCEVFLLFKKEGYHCYYKGHPDQPIDENEDFKRLVKFLPSYLPAEFISNKNVISLSVTSGVISNNIRSGLCVSLINLIPFVSIDFRDNALRVLKNKTKTTVFCPEVFDDFVILIKNLFFLDQILIKVKL